MTQRRVDRTPPSRDRADLSRSRVWSTDRLFLLALVGEGGEANRPAWTIT
jgi:hypothetical protein